MDLLKNLVFIAALAVVAGGVYILLTNNPQTKAPEGYQGWSSQTNGPKIEMPAQPAANYSMPGGSLSMNAVPGMPATPSPMSGMPQPAPGASEAPPFGSPTPGIAAPGGEAPPFRPTPPAAALQSGSDAPPFSPSAGNNHPNIPTNHTVPFDSNASTFPPVNPGLSANPTTGFAPASPSPPFASPAPSATLPPLGTAPAGPAPSATSGVRSEFSAFIQAALKKLDEGGLAEAHERLSLFYANPGLTPEEDQQLTSLLDQVAGTVIYSRQHYLEPAYRVQPGETLQQIADRYDVPWQLLAKINGIREPDRLVPGQELKVVRGPFNAVIRLDRYELTLMLHGRYAGRFPIGIGQDQPILTGLQLVKDKMMNPTYYGSGQVIDANDPNNPLGERLIGLGNRLSLHGTNDPQSIGRTGGPGTIRLSNRDIEDVYDILSIGSRVVIQR